jgi:glycine cleavage system transcriptional repressor
MPQHAILTALGTDRPGLVDEVSQFIFERGGNIEDSRMVNLRGQFAMMVLLGGEEPALAKLRNELGDFARTARLHAQLAPAAAAEPGRAVATEPAMPYRLTATAMDQAGLVHRISHLLRTLNVNIESLETHLTAAPITGAPTFEMELLMSVPRQTPISKLREQVGKLCDELNIDWQLAAM